MNIPVCQGYTSEAQVNHDIQDFFGALSWMKITRNTVGAAKIADAFVTFGLGTGSADWVGILNCPEAGIVGRVIGIEAKEYKRWLKEKQSVKGQKHLAEQAAWREMIIRMGGIAIQAFQVGDIAVELLRVGVPVEWIEMAHERWAGLSRREWWNA